MSYPYSSLYLETQRAKMKLAALFGQKEGPAPTDRPVVPSWFETLRAKIALAQAQ
jgi:hypothetical protein